jgi:hypothetical protein
MARRAPEWLWALGVGGITALICMIPQWRGEFFYYVGDQHEQFAPLWHHFGEQLREGRWPTMDPAGWMGGNYAAEALTGIWNPLNLLNFVVVSFFDNLSLASFVVMLEILAILGVGAFLLAREYGAHRIPAAVLGTAVPVSGFTLWYEASGWPAGLMAFTWVTHFWWSARRHSRGHLTPVVPFAFGFLAVTTGNPYATLGVIVVLTALSVELLLQRQWRRLANLVLVGTCVGTVALLVFLPLLGTSEVTSRQQLAEIANDTFLVPDLGDLAAASSPTYLPSIANWNGALLETLPSTYFCWFLLPLAPWLRWHTLRPLARSAPSVFVVGVTYLAATLGPSNLWLFRWPIRLIEYLYLALAVLVAVVLSAGLATDRPRRRATASAVLAVGGAYLAWAVQPAEYNRIHLAGLLLVGVLITGALLAYRLRGSPAFGAVLVVGTACVVALQTSVFPQPAPQRAPAYDVARIEAGTAGYEGTVLQLASLSGVTSEQMRSGEIMFGNLPRAAGLDTISSYTGMGFLEFATALCMDYRSATCPEAFDRLWQPAGRGVPAPLVDVLRVSTLVLQNSLLPEVVRQAPPPGWSVADRTAARIVWTRDEPLPDRGRVSWTSPGVEVVTADAAAQREVVDYRATAPGRVVFARLAWPGYTASVDGRPVELTPGPVGLVAVDVPAGAHTLVLEFTSPGLRVGLAAVTLATLVVLLQAVILGVGGRRRRDARVIGGDDAQALATDSGQDPALARAGGRRE